MSFEVPFRQIHMDFHTSEAVNSVGELFDPEKFAKTLADANVNYCAVFARCHHGYMYYSSEKFKDYVHPKLKYDGLLEAQIKALKEEKIKVPVYTTVQWDYVNYIKHPEWRAITTEGSTMSWKPLDDGFHGILCVNSPYRDFLKEHTKELFEKLPDFDGIFYDIVNVKECACEHCLNKMRDIGLNPYSKEDRIKMAKLTLLEFTTDMTAFVKALEERSDFSIYYNNTSIGPEFNSQNVNFTHQEFDCLPSQNAEGYEIFPLKTRFIRNINECVGQTGKFHGGWGDFHSLKNQVALEYEAFLLLALNCKVLVGDQLMPSGKLDKPTYKLIGEVYSQVKKKEEWCKNATPLTDVAVFSRGPLDLYINYENKHSEFAAGRLLTELGYQFDIIDKDMDFSKYKLIIVPDRVRMTKSIAEKFSSFIKLGGKVISSFESGFDMETKELLLDELGIKMKEKEIIDPYGNDVYGKFLNQHNYSDYIIPRGQMAKDLYECEYNMYVKGRDIDILKSTQSISDMVYPEFFRTREHFCSHHQAPSSGVVHGSAIAKTKNTIYFAHPIFDIYYMEGAPWVRTLLKNAIQQLLQYPLVVKNKPLSLVITLNQQKDKNRYICHLLNYIVEKKSKNRSVIDEVLPIYNVELQVKIPKKVTSVKIVPQKLDINYVQEGRYVKFTVPEVQGHQMIEINY